VECPTPTTEETVTMSKKHYTPNDQRSITLNPNHPAYAADRSNRIQQGHANVPPPPPPAPGAAKPEKA
jgi:hypothetical protein